MCYGFVGNVLLKTVEATAKVVFKWVREEIMNSSLPVKVGAKMARPALKRVHIRGNYESYGGSPLLGVDGTTIIGHGSSSNIAIKNAIRVAGELVRNEVNPHITEAIQNHLSSTDSSHA